MLQRAGAGVLHGLCFLHAWWASAFPLVSTRRMQVIEESKQVKNVMLKDLDKQNQKLEKLDSEITRVCQRALSLEGGTWRGWSWASQQRANGSSRALPPCAHGAVACADEGAADLLGKGAAVHAAVLLLLDVRLLHGSGPRVPERARVEAVRREVSPEWPRRPALALIRQEKGRQEGEEENHTEVSGHG